MGMKVNVLQYVALSMTAAESLQKDKILQFTRCHQKFQINLFESKVYNSKENKISTYYYLPPTYTSFMNCEKAKLSIMIMSYLYF